MGQQTLRELVARHAGGDRITETPIEGVHLFRITQPIERLPGIYPASMCCIVQGSKQAYLNGAVYTYDTEHYLCAATPLPVEATVPFATPEEPVLGVMIGLETRAMTETLIAYEAAAGGRGMSSAKELAPGLVAAPVDDRLITALRRVIELLDDPVALRVLADGRLRELLFTIIEGEAGPLVRRVFGGAPDLTRVLNHVHKHINEPLSVDELARMAGMSRAVFYRQFKAATSFSPLQFIKVLRLSHAAMRIVGGMGVSQAADAVGYTSASQFSREFRRQFGASPREWARTATAAPIDARAARVV